jgi:membrane protease YdiL (CAAX protease family)
MSRHSDTLLENNTINLAVQDWVFLTILVFLFLIVLVHSVSSVFQYIFVTQIGGMTIFSFVSFSLVFLGGIFWGLITFIRKYPKIRGKEVRKQFISGMAGFVGLKKVGTKGFLLIILAFVIGFFFNLTSTLAITSLVKDFVRVGGTTAITPYNIVSYLIANPIFEELIYRAFFIGFFLYVFGKNRFAAGTGLVMSSFVFGFTHVGPTWLLLAKTMGGLLLGGIYLTKWGKNYLASVAAHVGLNVIGIFTVIGT